MLIPLHEIRIVFEKISKKSLDGGTSVVILCSYDVDSLCATQILTGLLKNEGIIYKIIPVSGYSDLNKQIDKLRENKELKSLIFINNGGALDLTTAWFAQEETKIRAYVFDYHRPISHSNINSTKKIILIDDGYFNIEECPADEDFAALGIVDDEDDSDGDDDIGDFVDDEQENLEEEKMFDEQKGILEIEVEKKDLDDEEEELIDVGKKRKENLRMKRRAEKRVKLEKKERIANYYRGNYFGKSIAGVMYYIAQQLNKENLDYLWYWIIGITDQLVHNRISFSQYEEFINECRNEVLRMGTFVTDNNIDYDQEIEEEDLEFQPQTRKMKLETINKKIGTIIIERELRFFLLRNWTLYDSMYYSNYIAAKLSIWRERGKKELNKLITKVGVPLEEAQQQYKYMNNKLKKQLKEKILDIFEQQSDYDFSDALLHSFVRQIDTKTQVSAQDLTYALSAILEAPRDLESPEEILNMILNKSQNSRSEETKSEYSIQNVLMTDGFEYNRIKNFWYAYETLSGDLQKLEKGIEMAIDMQKKTMNEALFLIEKRNIFTFEDFRYCLIKSENIQEKIFNHPLTLQKLAILMLTFFKEQRKNDIQKPFLVCVHHKKAKTYLIVGISPFGENFITNNEDRNEFGTKFEAAADKSKTRIKIDNFESSVIEIHEDDFEAFLEELTEQN